MVVSLHCGGILLSGMPKLAVFENLRWFKNEMTQFYREPKNMSCFVSYSNIALFKLKPTQHITYRSYPNCQTI